ncbi:MAG: hypothetical protein IT378_12300 [Sandaracinaceae bacterium]|nr:hypothetical protein [Sandaracinaceae bacterium]
MKNEQPRALTVPSLPYAEVRLNQGEDLPFVDYPQLPRDPRSAFQARPRDWSSRIEPFDDRPPRPGPSMPPRPRAPLARDLIRPNFFSEYFGRYGFPPLELAFRPRVVSRSLPLFDLGLVYDRVPRLFGYPPRCRINGVATPDGELVIGYIERRSGTPNDRVFRVARVDMRPGGRVLATLIEDG